MKNKYIQSTGEPDKNSPEFKLLKLFGELSGLAEGSEADLDIAHRLLALYPEQDLRDIIQFIFEWDKNHFWVKSIITLEDLRDKIDVLRKQMIGERQYRKMTSKDQIPGKLPTALAHDKQRPDYDLKKIAEHRMLTEWRPTCPECHGVNDPKKRPCQTCWNKRLEFFDELLRKEIAHAYGNSSTE